VTTDRKVTIGVLVILAFFAVTMFWISSKLTFGMDEYVFYRLSNDLPSYRTDPAWIYIDNPFVLMEDDPRGADRIYEVVQGTYTTEIYAHGPLAPAIVWPLVKLFGNGIHIDEKGIMAVRTFSIGLSLLTLYLIFLIMRQKVGNNALLFAFPIVLVGRLFAGTMWFYWDVFMIFFFVLTLYLVETKKGPRWLPFLIAIAMVNTKMFLGVAFLLPLVFKDKRFALCALSIIPWWLTSVAVTGDWLFWVHHYWNQVPFHNEIYTKLSWYFTVWRMDFVLFYIVTLGSIVLIKKHPTYVLFFLMTLVYGFGTGLGISQTSAIVYGGALVFPLLYDRLVRRIDTSTCPTCKQPRHTGGMCSDTE